MTRMRLVVVEEDVMRRLSVVNVLAAQADAEIVAAASSMAHARPLIARLRPALVIVDSLPALQTLRGEFPQMPGIVFAPLDPAGVAEAQRRGALVGVSRPETRSPMVLAGSAAELSRAVVAFSGATVGGPARTVPEFPVPAPALAPAPVAKRTPSPARPTGVSVVAIGVSTGGPSALVSLLLALPRDFPVPIVIVQHMPPVFTRLLAQRLTALGGIPVEEAVNAGTVVPGRAYLAPGDFHLKVERQNGTVVTRLHQGLPEHSCRPAVDVLFRSIAQIYGAGTLAVVLTGMGKDGLAGCERIKAAGGQVIVQDQGTSVVWGMPGFVANAGMADAVLPLAEIGLEIVRRTGALSPNSCAGPASAVRAAPAT